MELETTLGPSGRVERGFKVGDEIVRVLDPDRQAQQVARHRTGRALDGGAVLDQALDAAERGRALPQRDIGGRGDRGGLAPSDADRQHGAEAALYLPARRVVARK